MTQKATEKTPLMVSGNDEKVVTKAPLPTWRFVIPFLTSLLIFVNHYCRDSVGALEKQMETHVGMTESQYASLNSLYFLPNIITPLLVGTAAHSLGGAPKCLVYAVILGAIGHSIFAYACEIKNIPMLFFGRIVAGTVYEVIDFLPIVCTGALFKDEWGQIVGATNAFLRAGSVATFVLCPIFYRKLGFTAAIWFCAALAFMSIAAAFGAKYLLEQIEIIQKKWAKSSLSASSFQENIPPVTSGNASPEAYASRGFSSSPSMTSNRRRHSRGKQRPYADSDLCENDAIHLSARGGDGENNSSPTFSCLPFFSLSASYYLYLTAGMMLYGSMVPFWFTGSKFLQESYHLSMETADALLLIPEGSIIFLSFPMGYILDNYLSSVSVKLSALGASILLVPIAYVLLLLGTLPEDTPYSVVADPPIVAMMVLGLGYGVSNCMFWTALIQIVPEEYLGPASGLLASSLNVMPSVIPVITAIQMPLRYGFWNLIVLSVVGLIGVASAFMAAITLRSSEKKEEEGVQLEGERASGGDFISI
jgi:MFS family permease